MRVNLTIWFVCVAIGVVLGNSDVDVWPAPALRLYSADLVERVGDANLILFWLTLTIALFLAIAVHELGHALVGRLVGFRVHSIRVWRIDIHLPFKLSWYRGPRGGAGGWAILSPDQIENLAPRAALMSAAGPAANLLSAVLLSWLSNRGLFLEIAMLWSWFLGLVNLVPFRTGALHSDGHRILMLLSDPRRAARWLAMLTLQRDLFNGIAPEFLSADHLAMATAVKDNSSDTVSAHMLAYAAAFQQHRDEEAARLLETGLTYSAYTAPMVREVLIADAAGFQARRRRRGDLAEQWSNDLSAKTAVPWLRDWADAAVLHGRGEIAAALAKLDVVEAGIRKRVGPAQLKVSLDALDRWRQELGALSATAPPAG